jgi:hypothetical protein
MNRLNFSLRAQQIQARPFDPRKSLALTSPQLFRFWTAVSAAAVAGVVFAAVWFGY